MSNNLCISVPANRTDHFTVVYLLNLSPAEKTEAVQFYQQLVQKYVPIDLNGRPMLKWNTQTPWGDKSDKLTGPIDDFHNLVNEEMKKRFGDDRVSTRLSHVNVGGVHGKFLYPSFNMRQIKY